MEERKLRVFENRLPKKIIGPQSYEATGEWRKVRNNELRDLHSSFVIRVKKGEDMIGEVCSTYGVDYNCNSSYGDGVTVEK
jgi:hypothetical protein